MTWTVRALKYHTLNGVEYNEGDVYVVDESLIETLKQCRMAHRVNAADPNDPGV